ncbi:MAG: GGDEF domain-containing protein [Nanoarchaeota archaeon]|nr:GGDEF domain-containing protein [Nanoarchaeota archaeon]
MSKMEEMEELKFLCVNSLEERLKEAYKEIKNLKKENESLKKQAFRDSLTKLYNLNYYNKNIEDIFKESIEKKQKVGLYIIDLNNLKYVNDKFGHPEGDKFLKIFSDILRDSVRECDEVVRIGGDEFIVITRNATPLTEQKMRERLNNGLNSYNTDSKKDINYNMSISAGYALINPLEKNAIESAFNIADQKMYKEKHIFHIRNALINYCVKLSNSNINK